ncbi:uncharacterized protein LOC105423828 [Pogonomyrmex barbatus]|uniref:Uncharacterized protein LOC105423828 n=1 Tax=Pogonomyrmex barbatus TaxID=144034 RepID=A0A6I9VY38_9HYME|nr:uncharacterized protein LOC105423828 [Pogonomyrmex barbatus]
MAWRSIRAETSGNDLDEKLLSLNYERDKALQNTGWEISPIVISLDDFNFCVPLNVLLSFCEDYKRIVINARYELILIRARNDNNCVVAHPNQRPKITLLRIQWRMPHMILNDVNKLSLLRTLDSGPYLSMGFRSWDLYEFPLLQSTTKHSWVIKTAMQLEKLRYVIFVLQTGRKNVPSEDVSKFDDCKLTNIKFYLNSEFYPYDDMNLDFERNKFAVLYDISEISKGVLRVQDLRTVHDYHQISAIRSARGHRLLPPERIDQERHHRCSRRIRMQRERSNTTAYCLIIHDRVIEYNPLTNVVRKLT